jgi:hypothetical protein
MRRLVNDLSEVGAAVGQATRRSVIAVFPIWRVEVYHIDRAADGYVTFVTIFAVVLGMETGC